VAINNILDDEGAGKFLNGLGAELMTSSPAGFDAFIAKEAPLWAAALSAANIRPE